MLTLTGTPRVVQATILRIAIDTLMTDVAVRCMRVAARCGRVPR